MIERERKKLVKIIIIKGKEIKTSRKKNKIKKGNMRKKINKKGCDSLLMIILQK